MTHTTETLRDFFEENSFRVHMEEGSESAEIETWTKGGVNMIFYLEPFTVEEFKERVENFDIDEEIELHREDVRYRKAFTITQSVADFQAFKDYLEGLAAKL